MRKFITTLLALVVSCTMIACGNVNTDTQHTESRTTSSSEDKKASDLPSEESSTSEVSDKILVAYFSRVGNTTFESGNVDAVSSASLRLEGNEYVGNNRVIADLLVEETGGDLFLIEQVDKYPADYRETTEHARDELNDNVRPQLAAQVENMEEYNAIILVYPNWWGTIPMGVFTFLEEYDFSGKTILPLATHEGSGLGSGPDDIEGLCPEANVLDGLAIRGSEVDNGNVAIEEWLDASGIL